MERPTIRNEEMFMAKIYELISLSTNFKPGDSVFMLSDSCVTMLDKDKKWRLKFEFQENNSTMS